MNTPIDITLSLSPITPLDTHSSPPSLNPPPYNPVPWSLLEAHGDTCLCCIHNRTIIFGLRDELQYMFSYIENMFHQPTPHLHHHLQPTHHHLHQTQHPLHQHHLNLFSLQTKHVSCLENNLFQTILVASSRGLHI